MAEDRLVHKSIYQHRDPEALTRDILAWIADPTAPEYTSLTLQYDCTLTVEASHALATSALASVVTDLELQEIYLSPEQLAELLTMPVLTSLHIFGGSSKDWGGMEFTFPTLKAEHLEVLMHSPDAQRLRVLELDNHRLDDAAGRALRQALPHLETLRFERRDY